MLDLGIMVKSNVTVLHSYDYRIVFFFEELIRFQKCATIARKTIFSFSRCPEKIVFSKKSQWNMIFLVLLEKMIFLFLENMILHLKRKTKDNLSQKKYTEIRYFRQTFWKDGLFKKGHAGTWSFFYYLERRFFFPENSIFIAWAECDRRYFSRNTWKYDIFCVQARLLQTWHHTPLSKKIKDGLISQKYT